MCGLQETVGGAVITVHVMATLTASTPSPSAARQKAAASPGIWKSVPPPSPPPTAVERITTAKSYVAKMFALSNKHDDKYFSLGTLFTIRRPYFLSCMYCVNISIEYPLKYQDHITSLNITLLSKQRCHLYVSHEFLFYGPVVSQATHELLCWSVCHQTAWC